MYYWVLPQSGIPISCTTVQRVTNLEQQTDEYKQRMNQFEEVIEAKFQTPTADLSNATRDIPSEKLLDLDKEDNSSRISIELSTMILSSVSKMIWKSARSIHISIWN
jgi:hypothetical protein